VGLNPTECWPLTGSNTLRLCWELAAKRKGRVWGEGKGRGGRRKRR
jgi:hypothetical protein